MLIETLEDRRVLAVDWRNPLDSLDVSSDTFVAPIDALLVINDLNSTGSRQLPATRDPALGFLDVNGDQHVAPIDALLVINALNEGLQGRRRLVEGEGLSSETTITVTTGQDAGTREYQVEMDARFGAAVEFDDALLVYVVDPANPQATLIAREAAGTAVFSLSADDVEVTPGVTRWDGTTLTIDLSSLAPRDTAMLKFQLVRRDADSTATVEIRPRSNSVDPLRNSLGALPIGTPLAELTRVSDLNGAAPRAQVRGAVDNLRFDSTSGFYSGELRLFNAGAPIGAHAIVTFPTLPSGVTLLDAAGVFGAGSDPYLDARSAVGSGGLRTGATSRPIPFRISDLPQTAFAFDVEVVARENHAPSAATLGTLTTRPGDLLRLPLAGVDPDGDEIQYALNALERTELDVRVTADGFFEVRPDADDPGSHRFELIVSDGALEFRQLVTINVVEDSIASTRLSGRVLRVDGQPLAGLQVEVGSVQGLTQLDGSFTLDLGPGPPVGDTLRVRGELFVGAAEYPFIAEKLPLLLEREVVPNVDNVVLRPIFLPALDVAGGRAINPAVDTLVTTAAIPQASVFVAAGTLFDLQGAPFSGVLSITEVPVDRTPAALPANLFPGIVVTIQPGEMVFAQPAPLSLPNAGRMPPATLLDLWSINPSSGDFDLVGTGRVSADGQRIDTISGGIRNSSWHFFTQPVDVLGDPQDPNRNAFNQDLSRSCQFCPPPQDDVPLEERAEASSEVALHSGALVEQHALVTYQSLGQTRGFELRYNSLRADPRPILHFGIENAAGSAGVSDTVDLAMARMTYTREGVTEAVPGFSPPPGTLGLLPSGQHFWRLPVGVNDIDLALQADLTNKPTGVYRFDLTAGIQRFVGLSVQTGALQTFSREEVVVNQRHSVFGAGWDLAGLAELFITESGAALIVAGGGNETVYDAPIAPGEPFRSRPGDFGVLTSIDANAFEYVDKFQTVTRYERLPGGAIKIASVTDRNGNRTRFEYNVADSIARIVDPVGLATTFGYSSGKVTTITDPAGRVTRLTHSGENLAEIVDPDGSRRQFEYDADRRMTGEIDQRGFREREIYGFHGRVTQTVDKLGQIQAFVTPQTQGLFPFERTTNRLNPPTALPVPGFVPEALHTDPNGNVTITTLNEFGIAVAKRDSLGALPTQTLNEEQLPTVITDARGNRTFLTYDDRGNNVTVADQIALDISSTGTLFPAPLYAFQATQINRAAIGDLNGDGANDIVATLARGTNAGGISFDRNHVGVRLNNGDGTFGAALEVDLGGTSARQPVAVELRDFNGDNRLDLLTANRTSNSVSVLLGNGDGTFGAPTTLAAGVGALDVAVADFDRDGDLDFAAGASGFGVTVFLNDGLGGFATRTTITGLDIVTDIDAADLNGDGNPDLVVASTSTNFFSTGPVRVLLGDGTGLFGSAVFTTTLASGRNIDVGDLDGDGDLDIVSDADANFGGGFSGGFETLINDGAARFTSRFDGLTPAWSQVELADINQDGFLDIVAPRSDGTLFLRPGNGDGTFGPFLQQVIGESPEGVALGDIDGNATLDAVTTHGRSGGVAVVQGQRSRFFYTTSYSASGPSPIQIILADMNRDGQRDVVSANLGASSQALSVSLNLGGKFAAPFHQELPREARALTVGDFNGNGAPDVASVGGFDSQLHISLGGGDGTLAPELDINLPAATRGIDVATGDFDADGLLDLVVAGAANHAIFRGLGDGTFAAPVAITFATPEQSGGRLLAAVDIDGDLDVDILSARSNSLRVLRNQGNGTFAAPVSIAVANGMGRIDTGDVDGDGDLDVVVRTQGNGDAQVREISRAALLRNRGDGTFDPAAEIVIGVADNLSDGPVTLVDIDADGKLDLVSQPQTGNGPATAVIQLGNGDGTFQAVQQFAVASGTSNARGGLGIGDIDGDELLDFVGSSGAQFVPALNQLRNLGTRLQGAKVFEYDAQFNQLTRVTNELGERSIIALDPANGNPLSVTVVMGDEGGGDDLVTAFTYNARGQILTQTDPLGRVTAHEYDPLGRLLRTTIAFGTLDAAVTSFEYDAAGNRVAQIDPNGHRTELEFDALNRVIRRTDALGFETQFEFDAGGNATRVMDVRGNATTFVYDALERPVLVTDPLGQVTRMGYDANGNPATIVDPLGRVTRFAYDVRERVVVVVDPAGGEVRSSYDADNNLTRMVDQLGAVTQITYDARNRQTAVTDANVRTSRFLYDAADRLVREIDRLGRSTSFVYDDAGREVERRNADGSVARTEYNLASEVTRRIDELGRATTSEYDARGREIRSIDALGGETRFAYDAAGNRIEEVDALGRSTTTAYDALHRPTEIVDPIGGVLRRTYDAAGNVIALTDARGLVTNFEFDARNQRVKLIDALGGVYRWEYDAAGRTTAEIDPLGRRSTSTYDLLGNQRSFTDAVGAVTTFEHNARSERIATVDPLGRRSSQEYDLLGRITRQIDRAGFATTFAYDFVGNLLETVDRNGDATRYEYDRRDRRVRTIDALGGVSTITFDAANQKLSETDPLGRVTTYDYDALGRLIESADPAGFSTRYEYDAVGNRTRAIDPLGRATTDVFDAANRLVEHRDALGQSTLFEYDLSRNLIRKTNERGGVTSYEHDALDREVKSIDPLGGEFSRTYDAAGQLTQLADALGNATTFSYDAVGNLTGSVDPLGRATDYEYDAAGNRTREIDALGQETRFEYDALDRQIRVRDALGQTTEFAFDPRGDMIEATDRRGNSTRFEYDALRRLSAVVNALGGTRLQEYDIAGQRTREVNELGEVTRYEYDVRGNLEWMVDDDGGVSTFLYDAVSNQIAATNARGHTVRTEYDALDRKIAFIDALGERMTWTLDAAGNVIAETDFRGNSTLNAYDALDRRVASTDPLGGLTRYEYDALGRVVRSVNPLGGEVETTYDAVGNVTEVTDELGRSIRNSYDAVDNLIETEDAEGFVTRYVYDALRRRVQLIDPLGEISRWTYDAEGNVVATTDARGAVTNTEYDALNRIARVVDAAGGSSERVVDALGRIVSLTDPLGRLTRFTYNLFGQPLTRTDALGGVTRTEYDEVGNRVAVVDPLGRVTSYEFDANSREVRAVDPLGRATRREYDPNGNVTRVIDARSAATATEYDPLNRPVRIVDALGNETRRTYDALGRLTSRVDARGGEFAFEYDAVGNLLTTVNALGQTTRFEYDSRNLRRRTTDALGQVATREYDPLGRLTREVDARGFAASYGYDENGNRSSVTDANGNLTSYAYDALNRLVGETNALGAVRSFEYDDAGNLTARTDRLGRRIEFVYDALNRRTRETWLATAGGAVVNVVEQTYDAAGQRLAITDAKSAYEYAYSLAGERLSVSNAGTPGAPVVEFAFEHDARGEVIAMTERLEGVEAAVTEYLRDALGRIARITQGGPGVAEKRVDLAYDPLGLLIGVERFSDLAASQPVAQTAATYDLGGRTTTLEHRQGGAILNQYANAFDALDRLTAQSSNDGASAFSYDAISQLVAADFAGQPDEAYVYDAAGNRVAGGNTVGANNRQLSDGEYLYEYDAEGNRSRRTAISDGEVTEYSYDHRNRLTRIVTRPSAGALPSAEAHYDYDAFDRRIAKSVDADWAGAQSPVVTRYALLDDQIVLMFAGDGDLARRVLSGPAIDQVFAEETASSTLWSLVDQLGSVRDIVNSAGAVVDHQSFSAFGELTAETDGAVDHLFGFTGRELDAESGLIYFRNRYYDPAAGRFISEDPSGFDGEDLNLNRYVGNNPTNLTDPLGLAPLNVVEVANDPKRLAEIGDLIRERLDFGDQAAAAGMLSDDAKEILRNVDKALLADRPDDARAQLFGATLLAGMASANRQSEEVANNLGGLGGNRSGENSVANERGDGERGARRPVRGGGFALIAENVGGGGGGAGGGNFNFAPVKPPPQVFGQVDLDQDRAEKAAAAEANRGLVEKNQLLQLLEQNQRDADEARAIAEADRRSLERSKLAIFQNARRRAELEEELDRELKSNKEESFFGEGTFFDLPILRSIRDLFTEGIPVETLEERNARIRRDMKATFSDVAPDLGDLLIPGFTTTRKLLFASPCETLTAEDVLFDALAFLEVLRWSKRVHSGAQNARRQVTELNGRKFLNGKPITPKASKLLDELEEAARIERHELRAQRELGEALAELNRREINAQERLKENIQRGRDKFAGDAEVQKAVDEAEAMMAADEAARKARREFIDSENAKREKRAAIDEKIEKKIQEKGFKDFQDMHAQRLEARRAELEQAKREFSEQFARDLDEFRQKQMEGLPNVEDELREAGRVGDDLQGKIDNSIKQTFVFERIKILNRVFGPLVDNFNATPSEVSKAIRQVADERFGGDIIKAALNDPDAIALRFFRNQSE